MAWWLAYEELYGDMDEEYPIMTGISTDTTIYGGGGEDTISFQGAADWNYSDSYWESDFGDTITFTGMSTATYAADTINLGSPAFGAAGEDMITFGSGYEPYTGIGSKPQPDLKSGSTQKYKEDKGIADLKDYVASTYQGHYTNDNSDVQTLDLIHSVGDAESFCRSNAIKYLSRYDKKGQAKRDILKAMHYCLLLYYFSGNTNNETPTRGYETF